MRQREQLRSENHSILLFAAEHRSEQGDLGDPNVKQRTWPEEERTSQQEPEQHTDPDGGSIQ